jgi:transposase-like protein
MVGASDRSGAVGDVRFNRVWRKPRQRLSPSEKYEMWMSIVTGQATQREAAERYGLIGRPW